MANNLSAVGWTSSHVSSVHEKKWRTPFTVGMERSWTPSRIWKEEEAPVLHACSSVPHRRTTAGPSCERHHALRASIAAVGVCLKGTSRSEGRGGRRHEREVAPPPRRE
ncbi:hypothetical protein SESBI_36180 [Sesbania bispinosa]|nr:hypothetical protein SESBI_36180 [Sesbania bispinosa]